MICNLLDLVKKSENLINYILLQIFVLLWLAIVFFVNGNTIDILFFYKIYLYQFGIGYFLYKFFQYLGSKLYNYVTVIVLAYVYLVTLVSCIVKDSSLLVSNRFVLLNLGLSILLFLFIYILMFKLRIVSVKINSAKNLLSILLLIILLVLPLIQNGKLSSYIYKIKYHSILIWVKDNHLENTGWGHINWDKVQLAVINKSVNHNYVIQSKEIEEDLNNRFMKTKSSQNKYGDFVDSGVLLHSYDGFAEKSDSSLFDLRDNLIAASYIRSDISKGANSPIYDLGFNKYPPYSPMSGILYTNVNNQSSMIFCLGARDISSDHRYLHCDGFNPTKTDQMHYKEKIKYYPQYVSQAFKNNTSVNLCEKNAIFTVKSYYENQKLASPLYCTLGGDKKSFDLFKQVYRLSIQNNNYKKWNEFTLRVYDKKNYTNIVAAIFYVYSSVRDSNYISPQGSELKKYNLHLAKAQYYQKQLYTSKHIFKPIVGIDMDKLKEGKAPFIYLSEDQVV